MSVTDEWTRQEVDTFDSWREASRRLVVREAAPDGIHWIDKRSAHGRQQPALEALGAGDAGGGLEEQEDRTKPPLPLFRVPKRFLELSRQVAQHRDPARWELLYRMLWRILHGERHLLEIASDPDLHRAQVMEKAVNRDAHKMKAFVRFRKTGQGEDARYVAWHRSDHYVLPLVAPFFARRFDVMRWAVLTPDESVLWDGHGLQYGPGCPRSEAPDEDQMEVLWRTYYASIFNPARIKLKAMRSEMPRKYWATMPEAELISDLVHHAAQRVETMAKTSDSGRGAEAYVPPQREDLERLRAAAAVCRGCDLYRDATQTVFGAGHATARLMLVGEQPGDQEDLQGEPFVGPAGQLLSDVLDEVGLRREDLYVTNAVKHFKWTPSGKRRLHVKPSSREISACRPWLTAEVETVRPAMVLCLGATAAGTILGPAFRITKQRGEVFETDFAPWTMATFHPSALLRVPDAEKRAQMRKMFTQDLAAAAQYLSTL